MPSASLATLRALRLRVVAELGAAEITERYIESPNAHVDGLCEGGKITVAPMHQTVDTVIHELLHRMYPSRSERSIRRTTSLLRRAITDDEVQQFYDEYNRRKTITRTPLKTDLSDTD